MTEYTSEKVAEFVAKVRVEHASSNDDGWNHALNLATVLTAVSAERDGQAHDARHLRAVRDALQADRDRLHKAITEALAERMSLEADYILRAALEAALGQTNDTKEETA